MVTYWEEQQVFYYEIGLTLTQWADVEHALTRVYGECFAQYDISVVASLYAVESFRTRLQVIEECLRRKFGETPHWEYWTQTIGRTVPACNRKRNFIAHFYIKTRPNNEPGRRFLMLPNLPSTKVTKVPQKDVGAIYLRDIVQYRYEFRALSNSLLVFADRLRGIPLERIPKFDEPPPNPPTVDILLSQMRAESLPPLRSLRA